MVMRLVGLVVVAALAVSVLVVPLRPTPSAGSTPAAVPPPYVICPVGEAARRETTIVVGPSSGESAEAMVFSAGEIVASEPIVLSPSAVAAIQVAELTGLALAPVLVAFPESAPETSTVLSGAGIEAVPCEAGSGDTVILPGGRSPEGETFSIVLANPFAGVGRVAVGVASEVGTESEPTLERVVVPPRSLVRIDLSALFPARQSAAVMVTVLEGRVASAAIQEGGGDLAAWTGLTPGLDWYLTVPAIEDAGLVLALANSEASEVPYQVDVYGPEGLIEAAYAGSLAARGQEAISLSELGDDLVALRVVGGGSLAAAMRVTGEGMRAVVPGVAAPGPSWTVVGAGLLGNTEVAVMNPGDIEVQVSVVAADGSALDSAVVAPGSVATVVVPAGEAFIGVEADGDIVVNWTVVTEEGVAAGAAVAGESLTE